LGDLTFAIRTTDKRKLRNLLGNTDVVIEAQNNAFCPQSYYKQGTINTDNIVTRLCISYLNMISISYMCLHAISDGFTLRISLLHIPFSVPNDTQINTFPTRAKSIFFCSLQILKLCYEQMR
jgi:hypothetical protein